MKKFFQIFHVELENSFSMPELCNDFVVKDFKENVNLSAIHIKNEVYSDMIHQILLEICTRVLLLPHTTGVVLLKTIILWQHSFLWECCVAIWLAEKTTNLAASCPGTRLVNESAQPNLVIGL